MRVEPHGKKIAELRKEKGFKQEDLAKQIGLGESTLRKVETRDYPIPRPRLLEIANKLGVDVSEILH